MRFCAVILQAMRVCTLAPTFATSFALGAFSLTAAAVLSAASAFAQAQPQPVWQMQDSGSTASLRGIDSVDGKVAWASGTEGTVLKTIDGGAHWQKCSVPDAATDGATLDFRGVQAWDADKAIVMASGPGEKSRLYKTMDGCKTWGLLFKNPDAPDGFFDSFWMNPIGDVGIILGDPVKNRIAIFETADKGTRWKRDTNSGLIVGNESIGGFAASNGLFEQTKSGYGYGFVVGGRGGSFYFHRASRFDNWGRDPLPMARGSESTGPFAMGYRWTRPKCTDCKRPSDYYHVAVGGNYSKPEEMNGTACYSTDIGYRWSPSQAPPHGYRSTVQWSEPLKLWITAGTNGSDISRDDGRTWQPLDDGNWNALSLPFVVGPKGRIARMNPDALTRTSAAPGEK
jgi:hypothetical protein